MKSLNRTLSLVLVLVMVFGLFGVASAASYSDATNIKNTQAVETLSALNVISGRTNGSFDPTGIVTRAEMAKMICVALNGGTNPVLGTNATPTYTDIKGHWAEAYIEYCTKLGIAAGMGDGKFAPDATVTGAQAAKMILVALGYDAKAEGFTGSGWEIAVGVRASQKGLYADLSVNPTAGLTRDNAAGLIYNGINAVLVTYDYKLVTGTDGKLSTVAVVKDDGSKTIASEKFNLKTIKGYLVGVSYNKETKKYTYSFADALVGGVAVGSFASTTADYSASYGKYVEIVYQDVATDVIYGVRTLNTKVVVSCVGLIKDATADGINMIEASGTKYELADTLANINTFYYDNATTKTLGKLSTLAADVVLGGKGSAASTVYLVSSATSAKISYAVVVPNVVAQVTYAGTTTITAGASYTYATDSIVTGIKKGDFVVVNPALSSFTGINTVTKASVVTGATITGTKTVGTTTLVLVGGVQWMPIFSNPGDAVELNATYDITHVNGMIFNLTKTSATGSISNLVFVSGSTARTAINYAQARAFYTDGKTEVMNVTHLNGNLLNVTEGGTLSGLYSYVKTDTGYKLTAVSSTNLLGYSAYAADASDTKDFTAATTTVDAKLDGMRIASDAVIFVVDKNGVTVAKGDVVNKWAAATDLDAYAVLTTTTNGNTYIKAGFVNFGTGTTAPASQASTFAYIVSDPYTVSENGNSYVKFDAWNGTAKVTMTDKAATANLAKGDFVQYSDLGSGYVSVAAEVAPTTVAITAFDSKTITAAVAAGTTTDYTRASTTSYMYIDSKTVAGVAGGEIATSEITASGARNANAKIIATSGTLNLVIYDVSNKMLSAGSATPCGLAVTAPTAFVEKTVNGVKVSSIAANKTYACQGDTVVYTVVASGTATGASTVTFTKGANSNVVGASTKVYALNDVASTFKFTVTADGVGDIAAASIAFA